MTLVSANVFAGEVEQGSNGEIRITSEENKLVVWEKTGVTVTPEAQKHTNEWKKAFKNPNTIVPLLGTRSVTKMISPFKQRTETFVDSGIIYDTDTATVMIKKDVDIVKTKDMFNPFLIFALLSVFLLALSNFFKTKSDPSVTAGFAIAGFAIAGFVIAAFATVVVVALAAAFATFAAALAALVSFFFADIDGNKKVYWFASAAFYTLMTFSVISMYW